jgi:riboflavin-specific deaminase-like protein
VKKSPTQSPPPGGRRTAARPFVTANFAITADGRVSTRNLTPADFSSKRDKRRLSEIRATCDAVLVGVKTIASDNMTMGLPVEELRAARVARGLPPYPTRVLATRSGRIDPELRVFTRDFSPIIIFSTERMPQSVRAALAGKATLHLHQKLDLTRMLRTLRSEHQIERLVCEGGPQLFRALLLEGLIDELHLTVTPRIFGGLKAPTLTGRAGDFLPRSQGWKLSAMEVIGEECFLRYQRIAR